MGELRDEDYRLPLIENSSTEQDKFLDLSSVTDVDDFEDCASWIQEDEEKEKAIEHLIENKADSNLFRELCFSPGGLLNDDLRRKVWPLIVLHNSNPKVEPTGESVADIETHQYYNQVVLDVKRILKRFPPGIDEVIQADLQVKVTHLIIKVLLKHSNLHYYQGFHDVAITLLLVLGEDLSYRVLCNLATSHFHTYMETNMEPAMEVLNLVYILIKRNNPNLYNYLLRSELGTICFLPWVITWFGHVIDSYETVVRLFDIFIGSHEFTPIYLSAAIVLYRAEDIFQTPCDMPLIHQMLSHIPDDLPLEDLILDTERMMEAYPPDSMEMAIKEMHLENLLRAKQEEEERRKRITARKALPPTRRNPISVWHYYWMGLRRPLRSPTVKYVAISISVATMAWILNYIRPNLEGFP